MLTSLSSGEGLGVEDVVNIFEGTTRKLQFNQDFSLENNFLTLQLSGNTETNSAIGTGPNLDWPVTPAANSHGGWFYDSDVNYQALTFQCGVQDTIAIP